MFEDLKLKRHSYILLLLGLVLTLTQIISTTWCNANGESFGYFLDDQSRYHICVYEMPGAVFFEYGALTLNMLGMLGIFAEWVKTRDTWRHTKSVNLSRLLFTASFISVNFLLETLSKMWGHSDYLAFWNWIFDNFFYLFPTALITLLISGWTIFNKVEIHIRLKQN